MAILAIVRENQEMSGNVRNFFLRSGNSAKKVSGNNFVIKFFIW